MIFQTRSSILPESF
ncbi:MAG: hypothetical protein ACLS8T_42445 [Anaerobutyricum sp.]